MIFRALNIGARIITDFIMITFFKEYRHYLQSKVIYILDNDV
jgi:hypothetical protein